MHKRSDDEVTECFARCGSLKMEEPKIKPEFIPKMIEEILGENCKENHKGPL